MFTGFTGRLFMVVVMQVLAGAQSGAPSPPRAPPPIVITGSVKAKAKLAVINDNRKL